MNLQIKDYKIILFLIFHLLIFNCSNGMSSKDNKFLQKILYPLDSTLVYMEYRPDKFFNENITDTFMYYQSSFRYIELDSFYFGFYFPKEEPRYSTCYLINKTTKDIISFMPQPFITDVYSANLYWHNINYVSIYEEDDEMYFKYTIRFSNEIKMKELVDLKSKKKYVLSYEDPAIFREIPTFSNDFFIRLYIEIKEYNKNILKEILKRSSKKIKRKPKINADFYYLKIFELDEKEYDDIKKWGKFY